MLFNTNLLTETVVAICLLVCMHSRPFVTDPLHEHDLMLSNINLLSGTVVVVICLSVCLLISTRISE